MTKAINGIEIPERVELPADVKENMNKWRHGYIITNEQGEAVDYGFMRLRETGYIEFHEQRAQLTIRTLYHMGFWLGEGKLIDDGWFDGMKVYSIDAKNKVTGREHTLKWSDANQWWMEKCESGGWGYFFG